MEIFNYDYITLLIDCILIVIVITVLSSEYKWHHVIVIVFVLFVCAVVLDPLCGSEVLVFLNLQHSARVPLTYIESLRVNSVWFSMAIGYLVIFTYLKQRWSGISNDINHKRL